MSYRINNLFLGKKRPSKGRSSSLTLPTEPEDFLAMPHLRRSRSSEDDYMKYSDHSDDHYETDEELNIPHNKEIDDSLGYQRDYVEMKHHVRTPANNGRIFRRNSILEVTCMRFDETNVVTGGGFADVWDFDPAALLAPKTVSVYSVQSGRKCKALSGHG
jgi:hypothetical protein